MATPLDVLAWLDSLHVTDADGAVTNEKWPEAQQAHAALVGLMQVGALLVTGAMPATASGATCFVPRYQIDKLRTAIANIGGAA